MTFTTHFNKKTIPTRQYYLVLNNKDCNELDFSRVCNVLAEYAAKLPNEYAEKPITKNIMN